ncbi:unnamed protein product [Rhizophagus irregularis]|nr:unnamed protein product [Rhizophagus irregularis]
MEIDNGDNTAQIFSWDSLPEVLKQALPPNYTYVIQNFNSKPPHRTEENFEVPNFELDTFVDVDSEEKASEWVTTFQSHSKTTMPQTKAYDINGNRVMFRESRHCIYSHMVKKKQGKNVKVKRLKSSRARDINLFMHNHVINCAEVLSFRRVKEEVREELLNYFKDGHSPSSALYAYQDELHLKATDEQELIELLAD